MRLSQLSPLKNSHLVLLAGQSNANGYQSPPDTGTHEAKKGQYIFNNVSGLWERLQQNQNNGGSFHTYTGSVGIEMELLRLMYEYYGADQYIIKYAEGGTSLAEKSGTELYDWQPGTADAQMFNGFVNTLRTAQASFPAQKLKPKVLIWIQGENDTDSTAANAYYNNLQKFVAELRNRLGLPDLLLLQTLLADTQTAYNSAAKAVVNSAKIAFSQYGHRYVNIDGAAIGSDNVHFTAAGQAYIAQKVFNVLKTMV